MTYDEHRRQSDAEYILRLLAKHNGDIWAAVNESGRSYEWFYRMRKRYRQPIDQLKSVNRLGGNDGAQLAAAQALNLYAGRKAS